MQNFTRIIKEKLDEKGMTINKLAMEIRVRDLLIRDVMAGKKTSRPLVLKMADYFQIPELLYIYEKELQERNSKKGANKESYEELKHDKPVKIAEMSSSSNTSEESDKKSAKPDKMADSDKKGKESYEELKDALLAWIYQTALKIGWEKTFRILDEAREMMVKEGTDGKELQHLMGWYLQLWNNKPPEMFKFSTKYKSIIAKHLKELIHIYKRNNEDAQQLKRDYESFRKSRKDWNGLLNFRNQLPNIKNKQSREWTSPENSRGKDYYLEYIESLTKDDN